MLKSKMNLSQTYIAFREYIYYETLFSLTLENRNKLKMRFRQHFIAACVLYYACAKLNLFDKSKKLFI